MSRALRANFFRANPASGRRQVWGDVATADSGPAGKVQRVFLECTSTHASRYNTGIQRAVRNLVRASLAAPGPWRCTAVVYNGRYLEPLADFSAPSGDDDRPVRQRTGIDALRRAFHRVRRGVVRLVPARPLRDALHSQRMEYSLRRLVYATRNADRWLRSFHSKAAPRIEFRSDDILVLLDSTWNMNLSGELRRAHEAGVTIWVVVNDLIPLEHPDLAPEGTPILLDKWLRRTIPRVTGVLGISRAVAESLRAHLIHEHIDNGTATGPRIDHFYLGAGLDRVHANPGKLDSVSAVFRRCRGRLYLVVGTIEPRKNHSRLLNVFERLWSEGKDPTLLIMGRLGWRSDELAQRIRAHPELGQRLFWFDAASDAELDYAYRHASALIFASVCEGFGLPLVEAMQYGLPVLASDIAVFREIGADYPDYFDAGNEASIESAIKRFEAAPSMTSARVPAQSWLSWPQSARILLEKVGVTTASTPGMR